ncbi:AlwI family type II restriction endonuclease [Arcobacter sp. CECT 8989]|uniref:AlwI family type II restriction endonuclease n=1 Tax=Arcobacter sp. CECT 8989 TaxID=2044509 RepID=UPI0013E927E9|nr:AlwI family type II restriction endonuclease [Arcobacter sp. CECT 8989]
MNYSYFGNTTLRPKTLLYNIEEQLFLFEKLFYEAHEGEEWSGSNTILQEKYYYMLIDSGLLKTKTSIKLGTKDARAKSSPLENMNLIKRNQKVITPLGRELLSMLRNKDYLKFNNFLQIDLVSLFFLKAFFSYSKSDNNIRFNDFTHYLLYFISNGGSLTTKQFLLLPLYKKFTLTLKREFSNGDLNYHDFIKQIINSDLLFNTKRTQFIHNYSHRNFDECVSLLKSSNGGNSGIVAFELLNILHRLKTGTHTLLDIEKLFKNRINSTDNKIKTQYMKYILPNNLRYKNEESLEPILNYFNQSDEMTFLECFFEFIEISRCKNNLKDYADLNKRYLSLTGIFEFNADGASIIETMSMILKTFYMRRINMYFKRFLSINENSLNFLFDNPRIIELLSQYGLSNNTNELKDYKYKQSKLKLEKLIQENFSKEKIANEILPLFNTRQDKKIKNLVTDSATVPTIYEYVIALAWYYIDNKNIDFILNAGLSLDNNMLPKSHAVGGSSDFEYDYGSHKLMIEVTLTDGTNQRRAEMESVSRHLGNMLLKLPDGDKRKESYGIFIASYLDRNVLNDFRSRRVIPWENSRGDYINGMNILPLNTDDIIEILSSNEIYTNLREKFIMVINDRETRGSQWYTNTVKPLINRLSN